MALTLAETFQGEIVNFDSVQVYRGLDVGSAKLPELERRGIPHHLIDILDVEEELTAGGFAQRATAMLEKISERGNLPILAGGTGFYLRALLEGLSPAPLRDEKLRERLAASSPAVLHRFLRRFDPESAQRIHPNDGQKLIRAVEMTVLGGRPASQTQAAPRKQLAGYRTIKIGLNPDRSALRSKLDARTGRMFREGLLEETAALLACGVPPNTKALQTLGYKQAVACLRGEMTLQAAIEDCQVKTRQYAKRQMTWFRAEKDVFWLDGFGSGEETQRLAVEHVHSALS